VEDAIKCNQCGSFQGWRHLFSWYVPAVSALLAAALGIPTLVNVYTETFREPQSDARLISADFASDNSFVLSLINLGDAPAIISNQMTCEEITSEEHPLVLTVFGENIQDSATRSSIILFDDLDRPTEIAFDTWNAELRGHNSEALTPKRRLEIESSLRAILFEDYDYPDYDHDTMSFQIMQNIESAGFLPLYHPGTYHLALSARLLRSGIRNIPEDYSFTCSVIGEDQSGAIEALEIRLDFIAGAYGGGPIAQGIAGKN